MELNNSGQHYSPCLQLISEPEDAVPYGDIVLIHSPGRTSRSTWTENGQSPHFWPESLRYKASLRMARVWAAQYHAAGEIFTNHLLSDPVRTIDRFVKDVWDILANKRPENDQRPVIFVAHSVGGIVVKQIYLMDIKSGTRSTCAVLFFGTPHRGTAVEKSLKWSLKDSTQNEDTLEKAVEAMQEINGSFFEYQNSGLLVTTFYEALTTGENVIVDKSSASSEFPNEALISLTKKHENLPQYPSPSDPEFERLVRHLQLFLYWFGPFKRRVWDFTAEKKTKLLHKLLGPNDFLQAEFEFYNKQCLPNTFEGFETDPAFIKWSQNSSEKPYILLLHGLPESGKSILASYIIQHLNAKLQHRCQYFFFRYDDHSKESIVPLLKSLAVQLADQVDLFRDYIVALAAGGYNLDNEPGHLIWTKLFASGSSSLLSSYDGPLYWVIDGLDICDGADVFLSGLAHQALSNVPIRLLILSRSDSKIPEICNKRGLDIVQVDLGSRDAQKRAVQSLVKQKLRKRTTGEVDEAIQYAQGNFRWAEHIIQETLRCTPSPPMVRELTSTRQDVKRYWEMIISQTIARWTHDDRNLAKDIFTYIIFAKSPLTVQQLGRALVIGSDISNLQEKITLLCQPLVKIDGLSRLRIAHQSIWEFLRESENHYLYQRPDQAHRLLLVACLNEILRIEKDTTDKLSQPNDFIDYAITFWPYHLLHADTVQYDDLLSLLSKLLQSAVSKWIFLLASRSQLHLLASASTVLFNLHIQRCMKSPIHEVDGLLLPWAAELMRILGKFGGHLAKHPQTIYDLVPSFCPGNSLLRKELLGGSQSSLVDVKGGSDEAWDDILARIQIKDPRRITCTHQYIAVSCLSSKVKLISTANPSYTKSISHGEIVSQIRFSNSGHMLAIAGSKRISIWQIDLWHERWSFNTPSNALILDMAFNESDSAVLTCFKDGKVWHYPLDNLMPDPQFIGSVMIGHGSKHPYAPDRASFNQSATMIAVSHYQMPVSVWDVSSEGLSSHRSQPVSVDQSGIYPSVLEIDWTSTPYHVLTVSNGTAQIWNPDCLKVRTISDPDHNISSIHSAQNGTFIVTRDDQGILSIRRFNDLSLVQRFESTETELGFAPSTDGSKIYWLQDDSCIVWLPIGLAFSEIGTAKRTITSDVLATVSGVLPSRDDESASRLDPIEVLAVGWQRRLVCSAHSSGELRLLDTEGTFWDNSNPQGSITITQVVWNDDETYIAFADARPEVHVMRVETTPPSLTPMYSTRLSKAPDQLFFNKSGNKIGIVLDQSLIFWQFLEQPISLQRVDIGKGSRMMNHPSQPDLLIGFSVDGAQIFHWNDLVQAVQIPFNISNAPSTSKNRRRTRKTRGQTKLSLSEYQISKVLVSSTGSQILVQATCGDDIRNSSKFYLNVKGLDTTYQNDEQFLAATSYPDSLCGMMDRPLGFITESDGQAGDILAFLDKRGWIWTYHENGTLKKHFFLPYDYLDATSLDQAHLTKEGALIVPKDGCVRIISGGFEVILESMQLD